MEQLIRCDAHKKFSVFVAVNEKGQAGPGSQSFLLIQREGDVNLSGCFDWISIDHGGPIQPLLHSL